MKFLKAARRFLFRLERNFIKFGLASLARGGNFNRFLAPL